MLLLLLLALFTSVGVAFPSVRYVRISSSNGAVVINEVMVYPCGSSTNVALGGTVISSAFGGICSGSAATRLASYGNDGFTSCSAGYGNTFCSDQTNAYWQVNLGAVYDVCNVAIILSTTGTSAQNLIFYSSLNTQIMSASLTGDYAQLATCTSTACTVATKSCARCTNAGSCNSHATAASGNYPACTCTCNAAYTGAYCAAQLCTNAINCNGHADSVSGYTPSCTCTCNAAWTGAACASSNVCTVAADCSNQASGVTGNRPSCTCTCQAAWTGSDCSTSNVCTNSTDCSSQASAVSGNRPSCSCTCFPEWTGTSCQTSNVCVNSPDCTNHATAVSGNRPACSCTCPAEWIGSSCEISNVCTNAVDCSNQAILVSGNRPSCSCTCQAAWTGSTCSTSNMCTNTPDCNGHASTVTGNRPFCSCTCQPEWTDSTCQTSNVCTNSVDCNNNARVVSGNRPTCTCACKPGISGVHCDYTQTLTRISSASLTASSSASPTMSSDGTYSIFSSKVRTISASTLTVSKSVAPPFTSSLSLLNDVSLSRSMTVSSNLTISTRQSTASWSSAPSDIWSSTESMSASCGSPLVPLMMQSTSALTKSQFTSACESLANNWATGGLSCIVSSTAITASSSTLQFSRPSLPFPYVLQVPVAPQRQWRYNCPPSTVSLQGRGNSSCHVTEGDDVVLLTFLMTSSIASAVLECGVSTFNVSWTVSWAVPVSTTVEVAATIAAGGALLSGGGSAAAAMALVSLMSCSGKAPALASLGYVVSVFFQLGFSGMAAGNLGLIVGLHLLHFCCVAAWKFVRHSPSLATASSDMRFPALSLLVAGWLLPGSVYGAVAAITGNDDAAIGAVILGLVCISIGISQFLLHHEVLPHASYVPHDRSLLSLKGSRFPVLWWLIPESQWSPPMVVRRYHPLLTSRCRAHCWTAVMDTLLTCLLSVVAALGVGGDLSSCRAALIAVALLFFVYGVALAVLRAHRLPMDRLVFPFIQWGYGVLCVLKLFDVAESIGEAIQLVVSVLQMWQVGWSFWVFFVERSLAAAACGSAGNYDENSTNSEELTQLQCGPQLLSDVWLDATHARTVLHVDAKAPLFSFFPPLSEIADDEAKFWSLDGLAVLHERGSHDSPLLMQRSVSLADSSMLDGIIVSIEGSFGRNETMYDCNEK